MKSVRAEKGSKLLVLGLEFEMYNQRTPDRISTSANNEKATNWSKMTSHHKMFKNNPNHKQL